MGLRLNGHGALSAGTSSSSNVLFFLRRPVTSSTTCLRSWLPSAPCHRARLCGAELSEPTTSTGFGQGELLAPEFRAGVLIIVDEVYLIVAKYIAVYPNHHRVARTLAGTHTRAPPSVAPSLSLTNWAVLVTECGGHTFERQHFTFTASFLPKVTVIRLRLLDEFEAPLQQVLFSE